MIDGSRGVDAIDSDSASDWLRMDWVVGAESGGSGGVEERMIDIWGPEWTIPACGKGDEEAIM